MSRPITQKDVDDLDRRIEQLEAENADHLRKICLLEEILAGERAAMHAAARRKSWGNAP